MDIRASGPPAAAAAEAPCVVAEAAVTAVADIDRSEKHHGENQFY
jgi:hypothetical protein